MTSRHLFSSFFLGTLLSLTACGGGGGGGGNSDGGGGGNTVDAGPGTPDAAVDTFADAGLIPQVCDNLPALPRATTTESWNSSEDFTFDTEGNLWGVSLQDGALSKIARDGTRTVVLPNVSSFGRGIRFLPNGDMVIAEPDEGALIRITSDGQTSTILGNIREPNGIAIHPNGMVYLTGVEGILYRIDPDTGANTHLVDGGPSLDGIVFSRDFRTLYYDTEAGTVFSIPLDEDGIPEAEGSRYVDLPEIELLDGMALDDCGNLYVVEMSGIVWRIKPDKTIEKAVELGVGGPFGGGVFICAISFGSGKGGWDANTLYIMDLQGQIHEAPIGVGAAPLPF